MDTTVSSQELNQDISCGKQATGEDPVIIANRSPATQILLSHKDNQRLGSEQPGIIVAMSTPE